MYEVRRYDEVVAVFPSYFKTYQWLKALPVRSVAAALSTYSVSYTG